MIMPGPYIIMLVSQRGDYPHKYPFAEEGSWDELDQRHSLNERVRDCYDEDRYEVKLCDAVDNFREYTIVDGSGDPPEKGAIWSLTEK
jgi:hypothetical protein